MDSLHLAKFTGYRRTSNNILPLLLRLDIRQNLQLQHLIPDIRCHFNRRRLLYVRHHYDTLEKIDKVISCTERCGEVRAVF